MMFLAIKRCRTCQQLVHFNIILSLLKDQIVLDQLDYNQQNQVEKMKKSLDTSFKILILKVIELFYHAFKSKITKRTLNVSFKNFLRVN